MSFAMVTERNQDKYVNNNNSNCNYSVMMIIKILIRVAMQWELEKEYWYKSWNSSSNILIS